MVTTTQDTQLPADTPESVATKLLTEQRKQDRISAANAKFKSSYDDRMHEDFLRRQNDHKEHERIWLLPYDGEQVLWCDHDATDAGDGQQYVRADIYEAQAAEIARLTEESAIATADLLIAAASDNVLSARARAAEERATRAEGALVAMTAERNDWRERWSAHGNDLAAIIAQRDAALAAAEVQIERLTKMNAAAAADAVTLGIRYARERAQVQAMREALEGLEAANERLAAGRSQEAYLAMIDGGQADALLALDDARDIARAALATAATGDALPTGQAATEQKDA